MRDNEIYSFSAQVPKGRKRSKWFCRRTYAAESKTTGENLNQWLQRVAQEISLATLRAKRAGIVSVASILHDKDIDEDGNPKTEHIHFVVLMENTHGITQEQAMDLFGCDSSFSCQPVRRLTDAYRYLTHVSEGAMNDRKQRYSEERVRIDVDQDTAAIYATSPRGILDWYYDACSGKIDRKGEADAKSRKKEVIGLYKLAVERGQISADQAFSKIENDIACEGLDIDDAQKAQPGLEQAEKRFMKRLVLACESMAWPKTLIYIHGRGGEGKTTLARAIANRLKNDRGIHQIAAKGRNTSFDAADGYNMQVVSMANEVRGGSFGVDQFCDMFDSKFVTKVNSRNDDKLFLPNYVLMTNSVHLEQFIYDMCFNLLDSTAVGLRYIGDDPSLRLQSVEQHSPNVDKIRQVRRRFALDVQISNGYVYVYVRLDAYNVSHMYVYDQPEPGKEPFMCIGSVPYNPTDESNLDAAVALVEKAIGLYYSLNGYTVTPLDHGWGSYDGGEYVSLPNEGSDLVLEKETKVRYCGLPNGEMSVAEFAEWLERGLDRLTQYANPAVRDGEIPGIYQTCSTLNGAFYHAKDMRIIPRATMNRFRDLRNYLIEQRKWIKRQS